jgi:hypothetical protein
MWVNKAATVRQSGAGTKPYFDSGISSAICRVLLPFCFRLMVVSPGY